MMKARILSLFLALTLLTGSASPALAAGGYSDVPRDHWAAQSVRRAGELGLFQGVGGGRFGLGEPITRAAFVTALVRLFGWEAVPRVRRTLRGGAGGCGEPDRREPGMCRIPPFF